MKLRVTLCFATVVAAIRAQDSRPANSEIVVATRGEDPLGVATTASEGSVSGARIRERALPRTGAVLESVPGLVVTQHSGSGKANQFFVRGFDLDHGTDFATTVAGLPVNLSTHAHGQGYTDLGFLIPELVDRVEYWKGPYHAELGDFSSAGAARIGYVRALDHGLAKLEAGSFGYERALFAGSQRFGTADLLAAVELAHADGPWEVEEDLVKRNFLARWSEGDDRQGWSLTALGYAAKWTATDQIPRRALAAGTVGRYGTLDPTDGGETSRYSVTGEWHGGDGSTRTSLSGFATAYDLDLFSNFTYFLVDPSDGDQFEQKERRIAFGAELRHAIDHEALHAPCETNLGVALRHDHIGNSLGATRERQRLRTTRTDDVGLTTLGAWVSTESRWTPWLRTRAGLRGDALLVDVASDRAANSGSRADALVSPKFGVVLGPFARTEVYASAGLGFHSNDGRGALTRDDPTTPEPGDGRRLKPLVQTRGAEVGVRSEPGAGWTTCLTAWMLELDSELVFAGDAGATEASRASRRYGAEARAEWSPGSWLTAEFDVATARALYSGRDPEGRHVPGSLQGVVSGGLTVRPAAGTSAGLHARYFGPRALVEDGSVHSHGSMLWDARLVHAPSARCELSVDVLNLFSAKVSDIDYLYTSRLPGEPGAGVSDVHTHPAEPFGIRVAVRIAF